MPSLHQPRRPRASALWQLVRCVWEEFLAGYEEHYRPAMGPLRPETVEHVEDFLRCGDLAAGFTRFLCPDCGHQHLLAFTCKSRHFCPACHQRRTLQTGAWIANSVCQPVPHRQFVFTIPKMLRGIFRKRRHLLHLLFKTATATLRNAFHHESRPYPTSDFETARPEPYDRRVSSFLPQIYPFHRPLSPQPPSLPVPEPANDATREKQFPFRPKPSVSS